MNDISRVAELSVISDAEAARLLSEGTRADLADLITASENVTGKARPRRRWLIGVPVAAGLAAAAVIATTVAAPGDHVGPIPVGPARAEAAALTFTRHGRYIDVIVRDPVADPRKYRAEFKAHHLNVSLRLVPVSPSLVGTLVYSGGNQLNAVKVISAVGRCWTGGGGNVCPVGMRIPVNFRGSLDMVFGRAARTGERYDSTAPSTAKGEALHGLRIQGRRVSVVLRMMASRHVTVGVYHIMTSKGIGKLLKPGQVPANWFVYESDPWAPGQVMLWVGRTRVPRNPPTSPGTPVATPKPSSPAS
jgi:hypothetical protein